MAERIPHPRNRPPGLAPRGSSAGFAIVMLYWLAVPALACMALMPFGRTVFDFLLPALACPVLGLGVMLPLTFGFKSRRYWGVIAFFWATVAAIGLLAASLTTSALALALTWRTPPALIGVTWMAGGVLLFLALLVPFPIRVLRLRYWQPKAGPADWEAGDERIPAKVVRALGGRR